MVDDTLDTPVRTVSNSPVKTVDESVAISDAATVLRGENIGSLVVDGERANGIVTETDLVRCVRDGIDTDTVPVGQVMTTPVVTIDAEAPLRRAVERMRADDISHLPVTDGDHVVGMVTSTDVVHFLTPSLDDVINVFSD